MDGIENQLESEFRVFTSRNFASPADCRNIQQIQFYIDELCRKIKEMEDKFNHVPSSAYHLLSQYNSRQNSMLLCDFRKTYR